MKAWVKIGIVAALILIGGALVSGQFLNRNDLVAPQASNNLNESSPAPQDANDPAQPETLQATGDTPPDVRAAGTYDGEIIAAKLVVTQDPAGRLTLYTRVVLPGPGNAEPGGERSLEIDGTVRWVNGTARYEANPQCAIDLVFDDTGVTLTHTPGLECDFLDWFTGRYARRP